MALEKAQAAEKRMDDQLKEEKKENQYKIANLAEELKNQRTRLDREAEKAKVTQNCQFPTRARNL